MSHTSSRFSSSELQSLKATPAGPLFLEPWAIALNFLTIQYVRNPQLDTNLVCLSFPMISFIINLICYDLQDINGLVGNSLPIQIPQVAVKWLTSALVLHIAALIVAAASAAFGLLAHVREVSMTCCSTFISGFAAVIALFAFIFDLIIFFVAKARISSVGSAKIGSAIWLTFAAWVLLFFSGCFYSFGRSCISNRSSNKGYDNNNGRTSEDYASNQRRLDAVKAEADRKARQKQNQPEIGLPAFSEAENVPLTAYIRGDQVDIGPPQASGYVERAPGTRAVDDYYENTYPPQPSAPSVYPSSASADPYASNALPPATVPQLPTRQYTLPTERPYGYTSPSPVQNHVQISNQPSCELACIPSEHTLN